VPPKLADTDGQIQRLWHNISTQCVSIASSIDTTPPEMIPHEARTVAPGVAQDSCRVF